MCQESSVPIHAIAHNICVGKWHCVSENQLVSCLPGLCLREFLHSFSSWVIFASLCRSRSVPKCQQVSFIFFFLGLGSGQNNNRKIIKPAEQHAEFPECWVVFAQWHLSDHPLHNADKLLIYPRRSPAFAVCPTRHQMTQQHVGAAHRASERASEWESGHLFHNKSLRLTEAWKNDATDALWLPVNKQHNG